MTPRRWALLVLSAAAAALGIWWAAIAHQEAQDRRIRKLWADRWMER